MSILKRVGDIVVGGSQLTNSTVTTPKFYIVRIA